MIPNAKILIGNVFICFFALFCSYMWIYFYYFLMDLLHGICHKIHIYLLYCYHGAISQDKGLNVATNTLLHTILL